MSSGYDCATDIWRYINVYLLLLLFMLFGVPPAGTITPRGVPQCCGEIQTNTEIIHAMNSDLADTGC